MLRYSTYVVLILLLASACTDPQEDGVPAATQDTVKQMQDFRSESEEMLSRLHTELQELESQVEEAGEDARDRLSTSAADLREEHESLKQNLQDLQDTSAPTIHPRRDDIQQRIDDLRADLQRSRLEAADSESSFQSRAEDLLNRVDSTIQELEQRLEEVEQPVQEQRQRIVENLNRHRDEAAQRLQDMASASDQDFEEARQEITNELADLYALVLREVRAVERVMREDTQQQESSEATTN